MNRVTLIGQLTADPEEITTKSGKLKVTFRLATNYAWKDAAGEWQNGVDYHRIVAWRSVAEMMKSLTKGESILVNGKIHTSSWVADDGEKRYTTEVVANTALRVDQRSMRHEETEKVITVDEESKEGE